MGVGYSKQQQYASFVTPGDDVDWDDYCKQAWRSERAVDLDKHGGLNRYPVARGKSISAKLEFLQNQVQAQAKEIQEEFARTTIAQPAGPRGNTSDVGTAREASVMGLRHASTMSRLHSFNTAAKPGTAFGATRSRMGPGPAGRHSESGTRKPAARAADWRVRTHNARRKALLTVMVCIRFKACVKNQRRLRRVDSFSYYIPGMLQEDLPRYAASAREHQAILDRAAAVEAAAAAAADAEAAAQRALAATVVDQDASLHPARPQRKSVKPFVAGAKAGWNAYGTPPAAKPKPVRAPRSSSGAEPDVTAGGGQAHATGTAAPSAVTPPAASAAAPTAGAACKALAGASAGATANGGPQGRVTVSGAMDTSQAASKVAGTVQLPRLMRSNSNNTTAAPAQAGNLPMLAALNPSISRSGPLSLPPRHPNRGSPDRPRVLPPMANPVSQPSPPPIELPAAALDAAESGRSSALSDSERGSALSPTSKFGFTPAHQRSLMPPRLKQIMADRHKLRHSESGTGLGQGTSLVPHDLSFEDLHRRPSSPGPCFSDAADAAAGGELQGRSSPADACQSAEGVELVRLAPLQGPGRRGLSVSTPGLPCMVAPGPAHGSQSCSQIPHTTTTTSSSSTLGHENGAAPPAGAQAQDSSSAAAAGTVAPSPPQQPNQMTGLMAPGPRRRGLSVSTSLSGAAAPPTQASASGMPSPTSRMGLMEGPGAQAAGGAPQSGAQSLSRQGSASGTGQREGSDEADELVAERRSFAEEMVQARERMRADSEAAAQQQLEAAWEEELQQADADGLAGATLESTSRLMAMYVNRANASWALGRQWGPPTLWDTAKQEEWMAHEEWNTWKARMLHTLREGGFAIQLYCVGHEVAVQGESCELWGADPWDLMAAWKPNLNKSRVGGVPHLVRVLLNLAAATEMVGGREALARTPLVLHLRSDLWEAQLQLLASYNFCGLNPRNLFILHQPARPGYVHHEELKRFVQAPEGPHQVCGSGCALMQLNWVAEAHLLDGDGRPHRLQGTALEELQARGVKWLVSHQLHDLGLLARGSWLDLVVLPWLMALHASAGVEAATQVVKQDSLGAVARHDGSIILGHGTKPDAALASCAVRTSKGLAPVRELRAPEMCAGRMKAVVRGGKLGGTHYLVGLERHVLHLEQLAGLLISPSIVRPKLKLLEGTVHVQLDMSDVLGHDALKPIAVRARHCPHLLRGLEDLEELLPLLVAQDASAHFRKHLGSRRLQLATRTPGPADNPLLAGATADSAAARATSFMMPGGGAPRGSFSGSVAGPGSASSLSGVPGPEAGLLKGAAARRAGLLSMSGMEPTSPTGSGPGPGLRRFSTMGTASAHAASGGNQLVVFVTSNDVSRLAVGAALALAKPGRDVVHLVTVVSGHSYVEGGYAMLETHYAAVAHALLEARIEVLVLEQAQPQLLPLMERYVEGVRAAMVVMATKALSATTLQSSALLGSVTLAAIKRFRVPVLVVNANSSHVDGPRSSMRAMALVNHHAAGLVHHLCHHVLQPTRGDALLLCRVEDPSLGGVFRVSNAGSAQAGSKPATGLNLTYKDQQVLAAQRVLTSMSHTASLAGLAPPVTVSLPQGHGTEHITQLVNKENVHVLGVMLPGQVARVPDQLVHLLHTARCAVLVWKAAGGSVHSAASERDAL